MNRAIASNALASAVLVCTLAGCVVVPPPGAAGVPGAGGQPGTPGAGGQQAGGQQAGPSKLPPTDWARIKADLAAGKVPQPPAFSLEAVEKGPGPFKVTGDKIQVGPTVRNSWVHAAGEHVFINCDDRWYKVDALKPQARRYKLKKNFFSKLGRELKRFVRSDLGNVVTNTALNYGLQYAGNKLGGVTGFTIQPRVQINQDLSFQAGLGTNIKGQEINVDAGFTSRGKPVAVGGSVNASIAGRKVDLAGGYSPTSGVTVTGGAKIGDTKVKLPVVNVQKGRVRLAPPPEDEYRTLLQIGPSQTDTSAQVAAGGEEEPTWTISCDTGGGDDAIAVVALDGTNVETELNAGDGNDVIGSIAASNDMYGGDGNDTIYGSAFTDVVVAGAGDDKVMAGDGDDLVQGNQGSDTIDGETGSDLMIGGLGNDDLDGGDGDDEIDGGAGNDDIDAGAGADIAEGGDGSDQLDGGDGGDKLLGGEGEDEVLGGAGSDDLSGGDGTDQVDGGEGADDMWDVAGEMTATAEDDAEAGNLEEVIDEDAFADVELDDDLSALEEAGADPADDVSEPENWRLIP